MPPLKDYIQPVLLSSACGMMMYIKDHLLLLENMLCGAAFTPLWQKMATMIDEYVFIEVRIYIVLDIGPPTFGRKGSYKITPVVSK